MATVEGNPYDFVNPVRDPGNFAGRADELKEVEYYLDLTKASKPQHFHIALIGARSSGKTSLLNMIYYMANQKGLLPVRISLNNELVSNDVFFFKELFDAILTQGKERGIFGGFYDRFRRIVDKLEAGIKIPLLFGDAYVGWKKGVGSTIAQSVIVHDLKKVSEETEARQIPAIVLLFDECDLFSQNETLLQKIRNAFQELEGYVLVFSGTEGMFPAMSKVFSPIPRFFKRISVENFKNYDETKECVLKPLVEEEKKRVDEGSIREIQYFTGGSPYEVNLVSHYMYKRWKQSGTQTMALSVQVLDDVLEELERLRKAEHHAIANKVKSYSPETVRILTSVLELPSAPKEWLIRYNLIPRVASSSLKDLSDNKTLIDYTFRDLIAQGVIREDESKNLSLSGDQFDTLYLKYTALSKGIRDFFVGLSSDPSTNFWMKFERAVLKEFDQYQVHVKFDRKEFEKGIGKRRGLVSAKVNIPSGPPAEHLVMSFTFDELEKKFYLGTENAIRFRVVIDCIQSGFIAQVIFQKPEQIDQFKSKLFALGEKLEYIGLKIIFEDEIHWNNEANRLFSEQKLDEAIQCIEKGIRINPSFELLWINKARAFLGKRDPQKVVEFATKATQLAPRNSKAWEIKGIGSLNQGRNQEALADFDKSVELGPEESTSWDNRGRALLNLRRYSDAAESFQKSLKYGPENPEVMGFLGISLSGLGEYDESLAWIEKALLKVPNRIDFSLQKAIDLAKLKRLEESLILLGHILEDDPTRIEALNIQGLALYQLKRHNEAIESCNRILEINPNDARAWYNKACYQSVSHFRDEAVVSLKRAIEIEPGFRESAKEETDFDYVKTDRRFLELIGLKMEIKTAA